MAPRNRSVVVIEPSFGILKRMTCLSPLRRAGGLHRDPGYGRCRHSADCACSSSAPGGPYPAVPGCRSMGRHGPVRPASRHSRYKSHAGHSGDRGHAGHQYPGLRHIPFPASAGLPSVPAPIREQNASGRYLQCAIESRRQCDAPARSNTAPFGQNPGASARWEKGQNEYEQVYRPKEYSIIS